MLEQRRERVVDAVALTAVGVLLLGIHLLVPASLQELLAFDHANVEPWAVYTAAFVHNSNIHLLGNLLGYGVGAAVAYSLCIQQDRRRWFWLTTGAFLTLLPILTNLTSYLALQSLGLEPTSRGFSGVVAGFAGFVLVALARDLADRYEASVGQSVGQAMFILLLFEVAVIYAGVPSLSITGLVAVGVGLSLVQLGRRGYRAEWNDQQLQQVLVDFVFSALIVVLLAAFVWVLFPANITSSGGTTNIIAHGAGFVWGVVIGIGGLLAGQRFNQSGPVSKPR